MAVKRGEPVMEGLRGDIRDGVDGPVIAGRSGVEGAVTVRLMGDVGAEVSVVTDVADDALDGVGMVGRLA